MNKSVSYKVAQKSHNICHYEATTTGPAGLSGISGLHNDLQLRIRVPA